MLFKHLSSPHCVSGSVLGSGPETQNSQTLFESHCRCTASMSQQLWNWAKPHLKPKVSKDRPETQTCPGDGQDLGPARNLDLIFLTEEKAGRMQTCVTSSKLCFNCSTLGAEWRMSFFTPVGAGGRDKKQGSKWWGWSVLRQNKEDREKSSIFRR